MDHSCVVSLLYPTLSHCADLCHHQHHPVLLFPCPPAPPAGDRRRNNGSSGFFCLLKLSNESFSGRGVEERANNEKYENDSCGVSRSSSAGITVPRERNATCSVYMRDVQSSSTVLGALSSRCSAGICRKRGRAGGGWRNRKNREFAYNRISERKPALC